MKSAAAIVRSQMMSLAIGAVLLTMPALADQPSIPRIGVIGLAATLSVEQDLDEGLRELGYVQGKNILIERRRVSIAQTEEELRRAVAELAHSRVDLFVVFSTPAARVALQTTELPVVFVTGDPVGTGLAASLARPGGRGTGVSMLNRELAGKRMELLRLVAPGIRRIVFLMTSSNPLDARMLEEARTAGRALGLEVVASGVQNTDELTRALHALPRSAPEGLLVSNDLFFVANKTKITQAVRKAKLPAIFPYRWYHEDGALISYGPSPREAQRKMAVYVDKILKGAKPGDLPIEQISKLELVIDLRIARELGLKVPEELLYRADEVIR